MAVGVIGLAVLLHSLKFTFPCVAHFTIVSMSGGTNPVVPVGSEGKSAWMLSVMASDPDTARTPGALSVTTDEHAPEAIWVDPFPNVTVPLAMVWVIIANPDGVEVVNPVRVLAVAAFPVVEMLVVVPAGKGRLNAPELPL